jgi:hypothetical protein
MEYISTLLIISNSAPTSPLPNPKTSPKSTSQTASTRPIPTTKSASKSYTRLLHHPRHTPWSSTATHQYSYLSCLQLRRG